MRTDNTTTLLDYARETRFTRHVDPNVYYHSTNGGEKVTLNELRDLYLQRGQATVVHGNGDGTVSVSIKEGLE